MSTEQSGDGPAETAASAENPETGPAEDAHEARITAAGGVVVGEAGLADQVDPSKVRRAPRYRRFAVFGGLLGLIVAVFVTPFASTDELVGSSEIFLVLALIMVPLGILLTCAIAMFSDRASRKRRRGQ